MTNFVKAVDFAKPIETIPCTRNPHPVPCVVRHSPDDGGRAAISIAGAWINSDGRIEGNAAWICYADGRFVALDGAVRNVEEPESVPLSPTAEWWAARWLKSATPDEKIAMRKLLARED